MAMMPAIFFGHGNPMNAIGRNTYTESEPEQHFTGGIQ
jgi:aromatic ring-opening dioxygenase catalytic subunit (LigB family)